MSSQLKKLPDSPGIYLYYSAAGELIYVGKATSLKNRVRSYFAGKKSPRPIETLIHEVADIKWQTTESVLEAIILEANTIKKHLPKYNVLGKDDKSWNYIVITKDDFPQIQTLRQHEYKQLHLVTQSPDHLITQRTKTPFAHIFGPYPGLNTKATMKLLRQMFRFSTCVPSKKQNARNKKQLNKPCFYYQLGQCYGVCTGEITAKEYRHRVIRPLVMFLSGKKKILVKTLEREMKVFVKKHAYEDAARLRDQISSLQRIHDIALLNKSFVEDFRETTSPTAVGAPPQSGSDNQNAPLIISRIEGYDISNLGATGMVGSMVVFTDGYSDKKWYRKFKIKTVTGQSDVDSLEEVLRRRLNHPEWPMPDLFLVDGGLPQVNQIKKLFLELGVTIPLLGIAKGPERKRNDFVFASRDNKPLLAWVTRHQPLLIAVRDEAHRFAITYQRKLRKIKG